MQATSLLRCRAAQGFCPPAAHAQLHKGLRTPPALGARRSAESEPEAAGALKAGPVSTRGSKLNHRRGKPQVLVPMFPLTRFDFGTGFLSHSNTNNNSVAFCCPAKSEQLLVVQYGKPIRWQTVKVLTSLGKMQQRPLYPLSLIEVPRVWKTNISGPPSSTTVSTILLTKPNIMVSKGSPNMELSYPFAVTPTKKNGRPHRLSGPVRRRLDHFSQHGRILEASKVH